MSPTRYCRRRNSSRWRRKNKKTEKKDQFDIENEWERFNQAFFKTLERGIEKLPQSEREELYRPCAVDCVRNYVLKEQQRQFDECGGDFQK